MAAGWGNGRFQTRELFPAALNAGYESDRFLVAHPFAQQLAFLDLMAERSSALEDRSRGCWHWRSPDNTPFRLFRGAPFYVRTRDRLAYSAASSVPHAGDKWAALRR